MNNIAAHAWNGLDGLINSKPFMPGATPVQQAEVLMELAEQDGERLGSEERGLILNYAKAVRDYRKVKDLVDELSETSYELRNGHADPLMAAYIEWEIETAAPSGDTSPRIRAAG